MNLFNKLEIIMDLWEEKGWPEWILGLIFMLPLLGVIVLLSILSKTFCGVVIGLLIGIVGIIFFVVIAFTGLLGAVVVWDSIFGKGA